MTRLATPPSVNVFVSGTISGQLVAGNHNMVINADHGAVVNVTPPDERPRVRAHPTPLWTAPQPPTGLLDREAELAAAISDVRAVHPVELSGEPGIGKTTLLSSLATRVTQVEFRDGLAYLSARRQPAEDVRQSLFEAFCESDVPYKPSDAELRRWLHDKRALVVLDDLELEREDAEALLDIAPQCSFVTATPKRVMWRSGIDARRLAGLPIPDAVALFQRELGRTLAADEVAPVERLCAALGGHPLRVLQAAARAREERRPIAAIAGTAQAAPALALSEAERTVVMALGIISAPMDRAGLAAATETPNVDAVLEQLQRRRIVAAETGRYRLAMEPLQVDEQTTTLVTMRALEHYSELAEGLSDDPARIRTEYEPIIQTIERAITLGWTRDALRLARLVETPLMLGARWGAWGEVLHLELRAAHALGESAAEAWALHQIGSRAVCLDDVPAARDALTQALRRREELGDHAGADVTRHNLNLLSATPEQPKKRDAGQRGKGLLARAALPVVLTTAIAVGIWKWNSDRGRDVTSVETHDTATTVVPPAPLPAVAPPDTTRPGGKPGTGRPITPPRPASAERPIVSLDPPQTDFGVVPVAGSADQRITLAVKGAVPVAFPEFAVSDPRHFAVVASTCGQRLDVGSRCTVTVRFSPEDGEMRRDVLTLVDKSGRQLGAVSLRGTGRVVRPAVDIQTRSLEFGELEAGNSRRDSLVVENTGEAPLEISAVDIIGAARDFAADGRECRVGALQPSRGCTIRVTFAPRSKGDYVASLVIVHNAADRTSRVALHGTARPERDLTPPVAPQIRAPAGGESLECPGGERTRRVTLEWSPVADASGIATYEVELRQIRRAARTVAARPDTSVSLPGTVWPVQLPCGGTYQWTVHAVDGAGNHGPVSTSRFATVAPPPQRPAEPEAGGPQLGKLLDGLRKAIEKAAATKPPAESTPSFRIDRFVAVPTSITQGEPAQLCYVVSGAASVRIDPVPKARESNRCITVRPESTTTYRLVAVAADGRTARDSTRVEVRRGLPPGVIIPVEPLPFPRPATPIAVSPGSQDAARPQTIYPCRPTLTWRPAPGGSAPLGFAVQVERLVPGRQPENVLSETVRAGTVSLSGQFGEGGSYRWSVRAVGTAGRQSDPTSWMYFSCAIG